MAGHRQVKSWAVKVNGLDQFRRDLKTLDSELPKAIRITMNTVMQTIVDDVRPRVPRRTGRAQASVKAASTQVYARIKAGSAKTPYYGWLEFGGAVGRHDATKRPRDTGGRYLYPTINANLDRYRDALFEALAELAENTLAMVD